ncbi:MAG: DUF3095 family protein [Balneolaceae bacterium]
MKSPAGFYDSTPVLKEFQQVTNGALYLPVPDDWVVIAGDIRGSTEWIKQGKYKEINVAGASIIAAVSNLFKSEMALPYSFGGDGAILVAPESRLPEIRAALLFCEEAIRGSFGMEMKTGIVPVSDIRKAGHDIRIARLQLSETVYQTMFWGEGTAYAEILIKEQEPVSLPDKSLPEPDTPWLEGLECRWQKIPSHKDEVTACIIKAYGATDQNKAEIYDGCIKALQKIYGPLRDHHPFRLKDVKLAINPRELIPEWKMRSWKPGFFRSIRYAYKLAYEYLTGKAVMSRNITTNKVDWGRYKPDLIKHADFRKFDDSLRFVLSSRTSEREELEEYLKEEYRKGRLTYGLHSSKNLIITCYITNHHREHIHFVDGADGGYALAAQQMKERTNPDHE